MAEVIRRALGIAAAAQTQVENLDPIPVESAS